MDVEPLLILSDGHHSRPFSTWASPGTETIDVGNVHAVDEYRFTVPVEEFFDRLTREQARFVDAVAQARQLLEGEPGQLAKTAALQARLTQQFLDAQRSILLGRADVDVKVVRIAEDADADADAIVAAANGPIGDSATAQSGCAASPVADRTLEVASRRDSRRAADAQSDHRSVRQQIADLGAAVVRTSDEADSLASVIDAAFELDDPDGAKPERQLRALLEDWWQSELQEAKAGVDDAQARAAMRRHVARIEAGEIIEATRAIGGIAEPVAAPLEPATMLPASMVSALDTVAHDGLDSLLAYLVEALTDQPAAAWKPPAGQSAAFAGGQPLAALLVAEPPQVGGAASEEAFDRFWGAGSANAAQWVVRRWIFVQVLRPIVTVVAALALVLAWIG